MCYAMKTIALVDHATINFSTTSTIVAHPIQWLATLTVVPLGLATFVLSCTRNTTEEHDLKKGNNIMFSKIPQLDNQLWPISMYRLLESLAPSLIKVIDATVRSLVGVLMALKSDQTLGLRYTLYMSMLKAMVGNLGKCLAAKFYLKKNRFSRDAGRFLVTDSQLGDNEDS
ncbi:hypothetical protein TNCV_117641 [Trichonephila clavipes]|nr:hypothetical protein TNCV_117641 [Trichonephila clavipes]